MRKTQIFIQLSRNPVLFTENTLQCNFVRWWIFVRALFCKINPATGMAEMRGFWRKNLLISSFQQFIAFRFNLNRMQRTLGIKNAYLFGRSIRETTALQEASHYIFCIFKEYLPTKSSKEFSFTLNIAGGETMY